jgi:hypothetical protein
MRNLVIARITELWDDNDHPFEFGMTLDKLPSLSNAALLEMLEEMIGFAG